MKYMKFPFICLVLYFYLAPSSIHGINVVLLVSIFLILLGLLLSFGAISVNKRFALILCIGISNLFVLSLYSIYHVKIDALLYKLIFYYFVLFISSYSFVLISLKLIGDDFDRCIIKGIILVSSIYSVIACLYLFSPASFDFFTSIYDVSEFDRKLIGFGIRTSGIFSGGYSIISVYYSAVIFINLMYISTSERVDKIYYITPFVLLVGLFMSGRLGLLYLFFMVFLCYVLPFNVIRIRKSYISLFFSFCLILLGVVTTFYWDFIKNVYNSMFEVFININSGVGAKIDSGDVLQSMWFFPDNIFLGDGVFNLMSKDVVRKSDAGYIMFLNFGGVFLLVYIMLSTVATSFFVYHEEKLIRNASLFLLFIIFCGSAKDVYFFGISGITQVYFILISISIIKSKGKSFVK